MKIFLTGGTGFIGQHCIQRLTDAGHQLVCMIRPGSEKRLQSSGILPVIPPGLQIVPGDVSDADALQCGMAGCDAVIHLANVYAMWLPDTAEFERVNVQGTRNVLEAARLTGVGKVIYVSTVAVYGRPKERPFREESAPGPRLFSAYARSKAAADAIAWQYHEQYGLPLVAIYPGIVLGPGDDKPSGVYIRDFINGKVPTPIFRRSVETYVHVRDTAEVILRALEKPGNEGEKYLVGAERLSGMAYARLICQAAGVKMPWMRLPDLIVVAAGYLFTWRANLFTHTPPPWGLSIDAAWTLLNGFAFEGSKVQRELGIRYSPVTDALKEAVQWYRRKS